jgi:hypothetical protein
MADIYMPNVRQQWAGQYGWSLAGGPKKMILHSTESDSAPGCVDALAAYLDGWANPTVVYDPWTGDMAMTGRADWAGGALLSGNRDGSVVLQVEAVGRAGVVGQRPFFDSPMLGWDKILAWCDSWGIPRVFPAGLPVAYPQSAGFGNGNRPQGTWDTASGYFGHSQVPNNDHGDPGLVDPSKIFPGSPSPAADPEVAVLPTIGAKDVGHPKSLAFLKEIILDINPKADVGKGLDATIKQIQIFLNVDGAKSDHGKADGLAGPLTWGALMSARTGGGK